MMRTYRVKFNTIDDVKNFVNIASHYGYEIELQRDEYKVDAKSILGVLSLGMEAPLTVLADTLNASDFKREIKDYLV
ncbi:MAG: HPr family phosphocarrier protein [Turicibacter sp.]|nr:HPr family phosphocarrier protein [Turicibacter sp.]